MSVRSTADWASLAKLQRAHELAREGRAARSARRDDRGARRIPADRARIPDFVLADALGLGILYRSGKCSTVNWYPAKDRGRSEGERTATGQPRESAVGRGRAPAGLR
jgi:hypothetical protein